MLQSINIGFKAIIHALNRINQEITLNGISPLQRPHYFTSSNTYKFFEKSDYCIVLHKISCTRQFESQLSLHSFALSFRVKDCLSAVLHLFGFLIIVTGSIDT